MPRKYDEDWTKVDKTVALHILKQGEVFLDAQLKLAIAADHRAMVTASILSGFGAALLAAGLKFVADIATKNLGWAIIGMAAFMLAGGGSSLWAARPVRFATPGSEPKTLWPHRLDDRAVPIGGEAENYQERIDANQEVLRENGKWLMRGVIAAALAPIFGALIWVLLNNPTLGVGCC